MIEVLPGVSLCVTAKHIALIAPPKSPKPAEKQTLIYFLRRDSALFMTITKNEVFAAGIVFGKSIKASSGISFQVKVSSDSSITKIILFAE